MRFDQLKDILVGQGWKVYNDPLALDYKYKYYVCRIPKYSNYDCTCNDKPPLFWVRFSNMRLVFPHAVDAIHCEVELGGGRLLVIFGPVYKLEFLQSSLQTHQSLIGLNVCCVLLGTQ